MARPGASPARRTKKTQLWMKSTITIEPKVKWSVVAAGSVARSKARTGPLSTRCVEAIHDALPVFGSGSDPAGGSGAGPNCAWRYISQLLSHRALPRVASFRR